MGISKFIGIFIGLWLVVIFTAVHLSHGTTDQGKNSQEPSVVRTLTNSNQPTHSHMSILVTNSILDKTELEDSTIYIYNLEIANRDNTNHYVEPSGFHLTSNTHTVYSTTSALMSNVLQLIQLNPGKHANGQVAFSLPNNETPSKLEYFNSVENVDVQIANLPSPSTWISQFGILEISVKSGILPVNASASLVNSRSNYYFSNQPIPVKVSISYHGVRQMDPDFIKIVSITSSDPGFTISNTTSFPFSLSRGETKDVIMNL
jgi:hypothetical protein